MNSVSVDSDQPKTVEAKIDKTIRGMYESVFTVVEAQFGLEKMESWDHLPPILCVAGEYIFQLGATAQNFDHVSRWSDSNGKHIERTPRNFGGRVTIDVFEARNPNRFTPKFSLQVERQLYTDSQWATLKKDEFDHAIEFPYDYKLRRSNAMEDIQNGQFKFFGQSRVPFEGIEALHDPSNKEKSLRVLTAVSELLAKI